MDNCVYPDYLCVPFDKCLEYFKKNPSVYIMLVDEDKLVGYLSLCPVDRAAYNSLRNGCICDNHFNINNIQKYYPGCTYSLYLSSVVIDPHYQGYKLSFKLADAALKQIEDLYEQKEITIRSVVADVVSDAGRKLAGFYGFNKVRDSSHNSVIMENTTVTKTIN